MITALALIGSIACDGGAGVTSVTWADVQKAIGDSICVVKTVDEGGEYLDVRLGVRQACGLPSPSGALEKAVETGFVTSGSLLVSLRIDDQVRAQAYRFPENTRTSYAHSVYFGNSDFLRSLMPRVTQALRQQGLSCADCPEPARISVRSVDWNTFAPYLGAHVWPDPVEDHIGSDGHPTGKHRYPFHVCLGLNGVSRMSNPDPQLVRAGFVLAMDSIAAVRADELVAALIKNPELRQFESNESRTEYMRERLPVLVASDPSVRKDVCRVIENYRNDLSIVIDDCVDGR